MKIDQTINYCYFYYIAHAMLFLNNNLLFLSKDNRKRKT